MLKSYIAVSSVTYAIKGREILLNKGFKNVYFQRMQKITQSGCGYGIYVDRNIDKAVEILKAASIPIVSVKRDGER